MASDHDAFLNRIGEILQRYPNGTFRTLGLHPSMREVLDAHYTYQSQFTNAHQDATSPAQVDTLSSPPQGDNPPLAPQQQGILRKRKDPLAAMLAKGNRQSNDGSAAKSIPQQWYFRRLAEMTDVSWAAMRQLWGLHVEVFSFRSAGGLFGLQPKSIPPARCWEEVGIKIAPLALYLQRFPFPTPIQAQTLPISLWTPPPHGESSCLSGSAYANGLDILGVAETGSGKTLSYLIPAVQRILVDEAPLTSDRFELGPLGLIVTPTKDLADQVVELFGSLLAFAKSEANSFRGLSYRCCALEDLKVLKVVGGDGLSDDDQYTALSRGVHLVVGTPGQLAKLLEKRYLSLGNTKFVAVDEADRMVEESMTEKLCQVLQHCPTPRQTILFTATMLKECQQIATKFLSPRGYFVVKTLYAFRSVTQVLEGFTVPETRSKGDLVTPVERVFQQKAMRLAEYITHFRTPILVFANTKADCESLERELHRIYKNVVEGNADIVWRLDGDAQLLKPVFHEPMHQQLNPKNIVVVHSDMRSDARKEMLARFTARKIDVIITTDLLARGLDVRGLDLVINFNLPSIFLPSVSTPKTVDAAENEGPPQENTAAGDEAVMRYIHRIGRTGRGGANGCAVSFVVLAQSLVQQCARTVSVELQSSNDLREAALLGPAALAQANGAYLEESTSLDRKRGRDDEETLSSFDQVLMKPLFKFLLECSRNARSSDNKNDFVSRCRDRKWPGNEERIVIARELLSVMTHLSREEVFRGVIH